MVFSLAAESRGYSLVAVLGLLIAVATLVEEYRLWGPWVQWLQLPSSRIQAQ